MDLLETVIIAIVEGLTEFLPVSSTGHMIIAQSLLGVESTPFVKAFTVIIQFGAILSVICLYWKRFFYPNAESRGKSYWRAMYDFYARLVVGVLPAVVLGLAFSVQRLHRVKPRQRPARGVDAHFGRSVHALLRPHIQQG